MLTSLPFCMLDVPTYPLGNKENESKKETRSIGFLVTTIVNYRLSHLLANCSHL